MGHLNMADSTISHGQVRPGSRDSGWNGVKVNNVRQPLTEEQIQANVRAMRKAQGLPEPGAPPTAQGLGRDLGIPLATAQFLQRLEARVLELEREVAALRNAGVPPHLRNVERRG